MDFDQRCISNEVEKRERILPSNLLPETRLLSVLPDMKNVHLTLSLKMEMGQ
jgi:hypothetical protein